MHGLVRRFAALIEPFGAADGQPPRTLLAFMRWALAGGFGVLGVAAVISAAAGVVEVSTALLLGAVVDAATQASSAEAFFADNLALVVGFVAFFLLLRPLLFGGSAFTGSVMVGPNVNAMVLTRLHRHTLGQAVSFFDDDFAGRIAQKQLQTARAVTDVVVECVNVVCFAIASLIGSALLLGAIDGALSVGLAVWLVAYFGLIRWFMPRVRARSKARAAARASVSGQVVDTITNIKTVKLFAHRDHEDRAAVDSVADFRERALEFGGVAAGFRFSLMLLAGTLPVLLVGGALALWAAGSATVGDIAAAGVVAIRIAQMTGWVSFTLMGIYANVGEIEDGIATLTPRHSLGDADDATDAPPARGEVSFDAVTFRYGRNTGGIEAVDLHVAAGEKVGVVGASGAGKSTLVALLLRLYDAEAGTVRLDGRDVRALTQESLRRQVATVTQETAMFNRSARDNIAYGRADATDAQIEAAARHASAHDFIAELADRRGRRGYAAHLGERGVKLSGGQRQRIALARAIIKDAPVLVLDEATSALDSEAEAAIQGALEYLVHGKTVIAIAHRLSTLARMDRIIVLDAGRIAESGTHAELVALGGLYADYWARQSGGFICVDEAAE